MDLAEVAYTSWRDSLPARIKKAFPVYASISDDLREAWKQSALAVTVEITKAQLQLRLVAGEIGVNGQG